LTEKIKILNKYRKELFLVLLFVSLIAGTFLRISLLLIYPILTIFIVSFFKMRLSRSLIILLLLISLTLLLSFFPHLYLKYKLLSLFYMLPFLVLLFSAPSMEKYPDINYLKIFIRCLAIVVLANDLVGFIQLLKDPGSDDSFTGIYSQFSVSLNGLMLLNAILFFYYFTSYIYQKRFVNLMISLLFMISALLCFYGAGLIICMTAFVLSFFRINIRSLFKTIFISIISMLSIYYLMLIIKPVTLAYNIENIKNILGIHVVEPPRKVLSFYNYAHSYPHHFKDFLFGSGPGTFNSRSAFMVGSPSYFSSISLIKDPQQPYYFRNFAYSLWNESNTSQALYLDGFRNQPFSSALAFLGEYGLLFTLAFIFLYFRLYRKISRLHYSSSRTGQAAINFRFGKFLIILTPLLLLIDNYFEYPEIMLLVVLGIKLAQIDILTNAQNNNR